MSAAIIVAKEEVVFFRRAADLIAETAEASVAARGRFTLSLCGGTTPGKLFELLSAEPYRSRIAWGKTLVFWGDERCVPMDSKDSNYRLAYETMLSRLPIPSANVFRMAGEMDSPAEAAAEYEGRMRAVLEDRPFPRFDFMLQGMGEDGHTASLFPGSPGLGEAHKWVVANPVDKLKALRLTVTFPVINAARRVVFLVSGLAKAEVLNKVLSGLSVGYPVERVKPHGETVWMLDAAAASKLGANVRHGAVYL